MSSNTITPFVPIKNPTSFRKEFKSGPFVLILRTIGEPWTPENIIAEIRTETPRYVTYRIIRNRFEPDQVNIVLDLKNTDILAGLKTARIIQDELANAPEFATELKKILEAECPGMQAVIEP